jgi:hypothetical protein
MLLLLQIRYLSYNTLKCMAGVAIFYSFLLLLYCLFCQTSFFRGIPFRSVPNLGMGYYYEAHGISRKDHLFRGTIKAVPSTRKYQNLEFFSSCCRFLAPYTIRSIDATDRSEISSACVPLT